jgi:fructokinase
MVSGEMRLWGFGSAAIDLRIRTAEYGEAYRDKLLAQETRWMGGGSTANTLAQAARLGGRAGWFGKLGVDGIGRAIEESLIKEGIDLSALVRDPQALSPFNLAAYAGPERRRIGGFLLPNCLAGIDRTDLDHFCAFLKPGDWLLIEIGEIPIPVCLEFADMVRRIGVRVVLDVDLDPLKQCGADADLVSMLFGQCDVLMPNRQSLHSMYPALETPALLEALYGRHHTTVIVSEGSAGSKAIDIDGQYFHVPALAVDVADTVGAGDAFHGGVIFGLSRGLGLLKALRLGTICGAHNCRTFGAREGMIRMEDEGPLGSMLRELLA